MFCFPVLLLLQWSHGYILLTADIEDVQNLAQQIASPEIMDQVSKLWRRASNEFRAKISEKEQYRHRVNSYEPPTKRDSNRRYEPNDIIEMAENATRRLNSFKKFVEGISNNNM